MTNTYDNSLKFFGRIALPVALVVLAGALVYGARAQRYTTTHLAGLWVARHDRLTGSIEFCTPTGCRATSPKTRDASGDDPLIAEYGATRFVACVRAIDSTHVAEALGRCDSLRTAK